MSLHCRRSSVAARARGRSSSTSGPSRRWGLGLRRPQERLRPRGPRRPRPRRVTSRASAASRVRALGEAGHRLAPSAARRASRGGCRRGRAQLWMGSAAQVGLRRGVDMRPGHLGGYTRCREQRRLGTQTPPSIGLSYCSGELPREIGDLATLIRLTPILRTCPNHFKTLWSSSVSLFSREATGKV